MRFRESFWVGGLGRSVLAAGLLLLAGCRSGYGCGNDCHDNFNPEPSQGGIFRGVVAVDGETETADVVGVVSEGGEGRFVDEFGRAFLLQVPFDESFTTTITIAEGDARFSGTFEGEQQFNAFLDGVFVADEIGGSGAFDGEVELDNDRDAYETPAALTGLAGVWADPFSAATLSIDPDGAVFFQDEDACAYSGAIEPVEDRFAVVRVTLAGGCGSSQTLTGLAAVVDGVGSQQELFFGFSSGPDLKAFLME